MRPCPFQLTPLLVLSFVTCALGSVEIDTLATWDGTNAVSSFGEPDTSYVGQSFVALDERITSVSFVLNGWDWAGAPYPTEFHLLVTPLAPTGDRPDFDNILFESGDLSTTLDSDFELFEIEMNVSVSPGSSYMWILDALVLQDDEHGIAAMGLNPGSYNDGEFLFRNTGPFEPGPRPEHDDSPWHTWEPDSDAAFRMTFVPEPSTLVLVGLASLRTTSSARTRTGMRVRTSTCATSRRTPQAS